MWINLFEGEKRVKFIALRARIYCDVVDWYWIICGSSQIHILLSSNFVFDIDEHTFRSGPSEHNGFFCSCVEKQILVSAQTTVKLLVFRISCRRMNHFRTLKLFLASEIHFHAFYLHFSSLFFIFTISKAKIGRSSNFKMVPISES